MKRSLDKRLFPNLPPDLRQVAMVLLIAVVCLVVAGVLIAVYIKWKH